MRAAKKHIYEPRLGNPDLDDQNVDERIILKQITPIQTRHKHDNCTEAPEDKSYVSLVSKPDPEEGGNIFL
jgi:hypothetical protein